MTPGRGERDSFAALRAGESGRVDARAAPGVSTLIESINIDTPGEAARAKAAGERRRGSMAAPLRPRAVCVDNDAGLRLASHRLAQPPLPERACRDTHNPTPLTTVALFDPAS
jgi:hypothetical protein